MPRISPALIRQARQYHAFLPPLLGPCRDLESAKNELGWLHQEAVAATGYRYGGKPDPRIKTVLRKYVLQRAKGVPLQYVIGYQPLGNVKILCRKGVFIPRPETESISNYLCDGLAGTYKDQNLSVLDLCTGTGCISLQIHSRFQKRTQSLDILGVDSSPAAIALANENLALYYERHDEFKAKGHVRFMIANIFGPDPVDQRPGRLDVLVANPPYISPRSFNTVTERSVRNYEPITALVPPSRSVLQSDEAVADSFYPRILEIAKERRARCVLVEVGDMEQAKRVVKLAIGRYGWRRIHIWRDWPEQESEPPERTQVDDWSIRVEGSGNGRAVFIQIPEHKDPVR